MIYLYPDYQQDTIKVFKPKLIDTIKSGNDSLHSSVQKVSTDSIKITRKIITEKEVEEIADTTSVCSRNNIADVTFYDSTNIVKQIIPRSTDWFPSVFTEINRSRNNKANAILIKQLKSGEKISEKPLHDDFVIIIIFSAALIFSLVRSASKSFIPDITRFFLFRGINDPSSRDIGGLFHWQSTVINFISFCIIALFITLYLLFNNLVPSQLTGLSVWLVSLGTIITAVTIRHVVCLITGTISDEKEVFREYLIGIYQSYRYGSFILFLVIVLLSYTHFLNVNVYFLCGLFSIGIMYLIRVVRLFIIFINRNISIFYLILYLCALEILPVAVLFKYFTGLF
jgi:hypothetical protein